MLIGLNWREHTNTAQRENQRPATDGARLNKGGLRHRSRIVHVLQVHLLNARFKTGVGQLRKQMGVVTRASVPLSKLLSQALCMPLLIT